VCASFIDLKVGVLLDHGILLHFVSLIVLRTCWVTFQAKYNVRSAPSSSALTLVSHQSHNVCTANRHLCGTYAVREKRIEHKGEQRLVSVEQ